jgi:hypothetical protein
MNQQWKHAPSEASQVIHRFILRNQELCKHQWGKGPVLNKIRSSEDLPKRQEEMVFYKTNLSQICHKISLVTTFSRTLQRLGFKVDNGQENTTVLKRKKNKAAVDNNDDNEKKKPTQPSNTRTSWHERREYQSLFLPQKDLRIWSSQNRRAWVANEREMKLERGERQRAESAAMTGEWREDTRVASETVGD